MSSRASILVCLLASSALAAPLAARAAEAGQDAPIPTAPQPQSEAQSAAAAQSAGDVVVTATRSARSSVALTGIEIQKILPGISPLKAIETLPGVLFETADPWGNNEQNEEVFVHGFSTQQLGYTMDGVPLGDQQYGNYNGLSPSRAVTSENVSRVVFSSGAASLGVASTSNLGGAIETFSRNPTREVGADVRETLGSYDTNRTFLRVDTGEVGGFGSAYVSYLHQDARAWDFDGHQRGDQVNAKWVQETSRVRLTVYGDWQSKVEPNEDAVAYGNQQTATSTYFPYTRPFIYPNYAAGLAYLNNGTPPAALGNNFSNYFSAAQRADVLLYAKLEDRVADDLTFSVQPYYHYDYGRGIVAGPINQAGLPGLFAAYFPSLVVGSSSSAQSLANLSKLFGGTGYEVRTTEYRIDREGAIANLDLNLGTHKIELGAWFEHNDESQERKWYPFSAQNDDLTPYSVPCCGDVLTQYAFDFDVKDLQIHLQDQWRIRPDVELQAGFKSSLQTASDVVNVQQKNLPTANPPTLYPTGTLVSNEGFLPQVGGVWDATPHEQVFFNIQKNLRQFIAYGAGSNFYGTSPFSLGSQAAFNQFKSTVHPETSWTYEVGVRTQRALNLGVLTSIQGQANYYHVDFSNRLLNVAAYNFINPGATVIANVGGVSTDGVDVAATLNFTDHFHVYDAISYDQSKYDQNYNTAANVGGVLTNTPVPIAGRQVPGEPQWLNKTIVSTNFGPFEAQINADYVGKRYATYLNDLSVKSTIVLGLEASYLFRLPQGVPLKNAKVSLNVTNLNDEKGVSTLVTTSTSGGYQAYPIAPRMAFVTLEAAF